MTSTQREKLLEVVSSINDDDYDVAMHSVRSCKENGSWDIDKPECVRMSCGKPKEVLNGKFNPLGI